MTKCVTPMTASAFVDRVIGTKQAAYVDISSAVCKTIASPCDDTVDGVTARPDGVHYEGPGIPLVVNALLERLRPILQGRP